MTETQSYSLLGPLWLDEINTRHPIGPTMETRCVTSPSLVELYEDLEHSGKIEKHLSTARLATTDGLLKLLKRIRSHESPSGAQRIVRYVLERELTQRGIRAGNSEGVATISTQLASIAFRGIASNSAVSGC
jgi:hypothetical protein